MRSLPAAVANYRAARIATHVEILVWIQARNRADNTMSSMGLWTGWDNTTISLGGAAREFYGAGTLLEIPPLETAIGLDVRDFTISLSAISPEVEQLIRGYDVKFAPIEVYRAEYGSSENLLGAPERVFKGTVESAPIVTPSIDNTAQVSITAVSTARNLTRYINLTKSDQIQRLRSGDRFRRYGSIAKEVDVVWGDYRKTPD